uniref:Tpr-related protein family member, putative n=1 Tax=Theileria annulata TaxID=5874 RepID=A0A3B0MJZ3_THEAN
MADFGKDPIKVAAYMFAGLSMMLNIRLVYSAAPYALLRFKLPENLFSVFVRIMAGSLELWCLPSMTLGNILDFIRKQGKLGDDTKKWLIDYQSIFWSWANFVTFVILLFVYIGGDQGHLTAFYWVIAASGFVFGIYMVMVYALDFQYLAWYMVGENSFPMVTSLMHYVGTLIFGNRRKYNSDYIIVYIDIIISLAISFVAAALWTIVYKSAQPEYPPKDPKQRSCIRLSMQPGINGTNPEIAYTLSQEFPPHSPATNGKCGFQTDAGYYGHLLSPSLMVLVGMGLVYSIYPGIAPGMIVPFYLIDKIEMVLLIATAVPPVLIAILKQSNPDYNPYVLYGNWGYEHRKSCKSNNPDGDDPNEKGECTDCSGCTAVSLKLKDDLTLGAAGNSVTLTGGTGGSSQFASSATITVTRGEDNKTDLSDIKLNGQDLTITITSGTIKNAAGNLQIASPQLSTNDVLALEANGTLSDGGKVTLKGTIKVTSINKQIGAALTIAGGPGGVTGSLTLTDATGGKHVNIQPGGTLTIPGAALETLKNATGTLNIGKDTTDGVAYKLVTSDTIILGLNTLNNLNGVTTAKVILKLPSLQQITIAPQGGGTGINAISIFGTEVTFSTNDGNFNGLKGSGATLTLNQSSFSVTIKHTKKDGSVDDSKTLTVSETLTPGTVLNISGTGGGGTAQINANILIISPGQLNSANTYDLSGGITGTLKDLTPAAAGKHVNAQLTISNISYDPYEIHDKHNSNGLCCYYGKVYKWESTSKYYGWHSPLILAPLQICLAAIFIYSLHYRESNISRSIVNQPKMSTALSIIFYMCHEILLAMGFPGISSDDWVLLPIQLVGAFLMVLLAYYSVGYITEYKRHDPSEWPTEGMTWWNSVCYWLKMASKITIKNLTWNFHLLGCDLHPLVFEGLLFYNVLYTIYHINIKHIIPHVIYNSI